MISPTFGLNTRITDSKDIYSLLRVFDGHLRRANPNSYTVLDKKVRGLAKQVLNAEPEGGKTAFRDLSKINQITLYRSTLKEGLKDLKNLSELMVYDPAVLEEGYDLCGPISLGIYCPTNVNPDDVLGIFSISIVAISQLRNHPIVYSQQVIRNVRLPEERSFSFDPLGRIPVRVSGFPERHQIQLTFK